MNDLLIKNKLIQEIIKLPENFQQKVLDYIQSLTYSNQLSPDKDKNLLNLAGILSINEAEEISKIIEDGCERVDINEW